MSLDDDWERHTPINELKEVLWKAAKEHIGSTVSYPSQQNSMDAYYTKLALAALEWFEGE